LDTSFASGPWILFRSSLSRTDWKIADETATPLTYIGGWFKKRSTTRATAHTWPILLKSCPKPVPTAIADAGGTRRSTLAVSEREITQLTGYVGQESNLKKSCSDSQEPRAFEKRLTESRLQDDGISESQRGLRGIRIVSSKSGVIFRTILNQSLAGLEFSFKVAINVIAMKGRSPNVRLMDLYFPVRCIDHLRVGCEWKGKAAATWWIPGKYRSRWYRDAVWQEVCPWVRCSAANTKISRVVLLTSGGGRRQHDSLEPHRKEVHYREVTETDQEIAGPEENGDFLFEKKWRQHGLDGEFQLNNKEEEEECDGGYESRDNSHVIPLRNI